MIVNKKIVGIIFTSIISIILVNLGGAILQKEVIIGITTVLIGFTFIYFLYYSLQIKSNEEKIKEIEEWKEQKEEILNTLKDIIILKKISNIK